MTLLLLLRPHGASVVTPPAPEPVEPFFWDEAGSTPDELAARLAFTTVLCKNTGEPVDILDNLTQRQLVQQLNLPTSYTITMNMDDENYPYALLEQQPRVKVYRVSTPEELAVDPTVVNQLVFYGSLPSEGIDEDSETGFARLTFQEPTWVLNDRYVPSSVSFTNTDQGSILWQIIAAQNARTNGDTWIRQGGVTTGTLRDRTYDAGKEVAGLIDDMTKVDGGCDVSLTPVDYWSVDGSRVMALFNAHAERGTDQPNSLFIHGDALEDGTVNGIPANCTGMRRTRAKVITSATSVGTQDTQTYQNTSSPFGLLESFETFSDVSISQTLLDKSVGKVANSQNAPMILEVKNPLPNAPQPFLDYNVGDTVYATCRRGGMQFYSLAVRVHGIDITLSENGELATKLTLASLPEDVIFVPVPGGGVGGGDANPPGNERVNPPSGSTSGGNSVLTTTVTHGSDPTYALSTFPTAESGTSGFIQGLVPGDDYTISTWTRGTSSALDGSGSGWGLRVRYYGSNSVLAQSANQATRIWNATQATRETWTLISVTFTAVTTTHNWLMYASAQTDSHDTYYTLPTIQPA